jgi:hypothetical protein
VPALLPHGRVRVGAPRRLPARARPEQGGRVPQVGNQGPVPWLPGGGRG